MAKHLRFIADVLEKRECLRRFPLYLRAAAREISELRYENGVLRRKLKMKPRKEIDDPKVIINQHDAASSPIKEDK